jgi:delta24(24(1))-sterol reductase
MSERTDDKTRTWEFGGPLGTLGIMLASHALVYYLWISATYYRGRGVHPSSWHDVGPFFARMAHHVADGAAPTSRAAAIYLGFVALELVLAYTMPGVWARGFPVPSEGGLRRRYLCNGAASWYVTLALIATLHLTGVLRLTVLADRLGPMLTVAVLVADATALGAYVITLCRRSAIRMTGSHIYDFFMGAVLNPAIGRVDLKFFTEIRISWMLLFLLTLSAAAKHVALYGYVSAPLVFMVVAHGLYTNACMKGEECVPTTWDIFHEKWGWMLIFWNLVGVPWVYAFNAYWLLANGPVKHSPVYMTALFVALGVAYYVWDTAQSQKNRYRMKERGERIVRRTFPQLPWGTLERPQVLHTVNGGTLLVDGWWAYARKIHYTADIVMALTWALACGVHAVLPFLYPVFFFVMIQHRAHRDDDRCRKKYGDDWARYCELVPGRLLPRWRPARVQPAPSR